MNGRTEWAIGKMEGVGRAACVRAILVLALATASTTTAATARTRAVVVENGAAGLMKRPAPRRLPSEAENPTLAPLVEGWRALPLEVLRIPTLRSNKVGHLAIHRIRQAPDRPVLVFVHGVFSDHETWRYVAAGLADDYELWLVDLPGCGDSAGLKPSTGEPDGYSPAAMGERVLQAVRDCLGDGASGRELTLVGHSLGGLVVLRMISSPDLQTRYADVMNRVKHVVLIAPCDFAVNSVPPKFVPVLHLRSWKVALANCLGLIEPKLRNVTLAGYHRPGFATDEEHRRWVHIVKKSAHRSAAQRMLRSAVPFDQTTWRPVWPGIDRFVTEYGHIRLPVLIAYGEWDETLPASMGDKLKNEIPDAWLVKIPERGHALPTEDPEVCAELIQRFERGSMDLPTGSRLKVYPPAGNIDVASRRVQPSMSRKTRLPSGSSDPSETAIGGPGR